MILELTMVKEESCHFRSRILVSNCVAVSWALNPLHDRKSWPYRSLGPHTKSKIYYNVGIYLL